jgi:hypothetical protein
MPLRRTRGTCTPPAQEGRQQLDQWPTADLGDDEIKNLSEMVVDFARSVGLRDADDDDLLGIVIAAYLAGKKSNLCCGEYIGRVGLIH